VIGYTNDTLRSFDYTRAGTFLPPSLFAHSEIARFWCFKVLPCAQITPASSVDSTEIPRATAPDARLMRACVARRVIAPLVALPIYLPTYLPTYLSFNPPAVSYYYTPTSSPSRLSLPRRSAISTTTLLLLCYSAIAGTNTDTSIVPLFWAPNLDRVPFDTFTIRGHRFPTGGALIRGKHRCLFPSLPELSIRYFSDTFVLLNPHCSSLFSGDTNACTSSLATFSYVVAFMHLVLSVKQASMPFQTRVFIYWLRKGARRATCANER